MFHSQNTQQAQEFIKIPLAEPEKIEIEKSPHQGLSLI